jgi:DNA gyrase subunit A
VISIKGYDDAKFLLFATQNGVVKKTPLEEYDSPRTGLAAINLRKKDELIGARLSSGRDQLILVSKDGQATRFPESQVRPMGRAAAGVIGMRLRPKDQVISMALAGQGSDLVTLTEAGYGKRTPLKEYPKKGRGGLGIATHRLTDKTGRLAGAFVGSKGQDVFVISTTGIVIRVNSADIRQTGRASQGVRVMKLAGRQKVATVAPVITKDGEEG